MKWIAACLVTLALVVPVGALVAAESGQGSEEKRKVVVRTTPNEAVIELSRTDREDLDKVTMRFSTAEGVLSATYVNEPKGEDVSVRYEKSMTTLLHQVLEYKDDNDNQRYDPGEPVASSWYMSPESKDEADAGTNSTVTWGPIDVSDVEANGKKGKQITAQAQFVGGPREGLPLPLPMPTTPESVFLVTFTVFGDFLDYQDTPLTPTEAKIDFSLRAYPFADERSRIAVVYETIARDELNFVEIAEGPGLKGLASTKTLGNRTVTTEFAWKETVDVDGRELPVQMSELLSESVTKQDREGTHRDARRVYALDYDRGANITHDPVMGVEIEPADEGGGIFGGGGAVPGLAAWAVVAAGLGAALILARRRS